MNNTEAQTLDWSSDSTDQIQIGLITITNNQRPPDTKNAVRCEQ